MATLAIIAGVFAFTIGVVVLWANPTRFTNQALAGTALIVTAYSFLVCSAIRAGRLFVDNHAITPIPMLRAAGAVLALFPWLLWIQKESLASEAAGRERILKRSLPWLVFALLLATVCFSDAYIPSDSTPISEKQGPAYTFVSIAMIGAFALLAIQTSGDMRRQFGVRRVEIQFLVLNSSIAAFVAIILAFLSHNLELPALRRIGQFVVIGVFVVAGWAVTYYRIYDIKQIGVSIVQRTAIVVLLGIGIVFGSIWLGLFVSQPIALSMAIGIFGFLFLWLEKYSRAWLGIDGERVLEKMRLQVIEIARTEGDPERLGARFGAFLSDECGTSFAALLLDQGEKYAFEELECAKDHLGITALYECGWATPESLVRRRPTARLLDLKTFMNQHSLGLIISAPRGSSPPSLLMALGIKRNEWPFTYPEVQRLQNIAELMDNILTRSRLTLQAAMRAKMEHLSLISRGLAHDLNNLITPISSFLVHTEGRYPAESSEREVHEAAQRSVRVMTDYVREALFFSARLAAKFEPVELGPILRDVGAVAAARAKEHGVTLVETCEYYGIVTADAVLLRRMLTNLVGNAIDASRSGQTITLAASRGREGWYSLRVTDQGCGIAPQNLSQIFEPYFTTKNYGDDMRGFGLGLTICQKIVHLHGGTLSASSKLGHGTTMTVELPVDQSVQATAVDRPAPLPALSARVKMPVLRS